MTETPADRIAAELLRLCEAERFHPGERIGSERELAARLGVPRTALRTGIELLEARGVVRRVLGRTGGLFFDDGRIQRHLNTVEGVPQMVREQGRTITTRVLRAEVAVAAPDERRALGLDDDALVVRVRRLRVVDGVPWSLDRSVLPSARFPALTSHDLTASLYRLLGDRYGLELGHAEETIEAVSPTDEQVSLLELPASVGLLAIRRIAYDTAGTRVEFATDLFRADRTRVHTQRFGTNWKRSVRRSREAEAPPAET